MASAAESIEKELARMIADLNEEIANLKEGTAYLKEWTANLYKRIRVIEQKTSATKEFINKKVLVQGNWPGGSSGRPVMANALGSSVVGAEEKTVSKGFETDNSNMESKPEEMGGTGREEGIPLQRSRKRFRLNFGCGPGSEGAEVCEGVVLKTQDLCLSCLDQCSSYPDCSISSSH
ncbi:hypothetical protein K1719_045366 [Acacia pycnantha]|nr:hypothetical protein K1719_045366 [Acacia pycnantha]